MYQKSEGCKRKMGFSQHNTFLQHSMMINKVPFVLEVAGSIAQDYTGHILQMSERCNRASLSFSLCVPFAHDRELWET